MGEGGGLHSVRQPCLAMLLRICCTLPSMLVLQAVNAYRLIEDIASTASNGVAEAYARLYKGGFFPFCEVIWPIYTPVLVFLACVLLCSPACRTIHYVTFEVSHAGAAGSAAKESSLLKSSEREREGYGTRHPPPCCA
jgi:hypothetical protein|eukprot:4624167-Prymnesium_polylepis.3